MLLSKTVEFNELRSGRRVILVKTVSNRLVVIQHPTTTILQELLMFLQTKHLRYCFVHFLRMLKKLFLSLLKLLS
jgi:hypothetical protein